MIRIKLRNHVIWELVLWATSQGTWKGSLVPNTKNHASCEQNPWLPWMSLNPVNQCPAEIGKGDSFDLFFSLTIILCAHVALVQEEHKAKHGFKPIVLSTE